MWIAGPIIDGVPHLNHSISAEVDTPKEAVELVDRLVAQGIDFIKPYQMLRPEVFKALVQRAKYHNLPVAGHIPSRMNIPEVLQEVEQFDIQHITGNSTGLIYEGIRDRHPVPNYTAMLDAEKAGTTGYDLLAKVLNATDVTPEDMDSEKIAALVHLLAQKGAWNTPTLASVDARVRGQSDDPFITRNLRLSVSKIVAPTVSAAWAKKSCSDRSCFCEESIIWRTGFEVSGPNA